MIKEKIDNFTSSQEEGLIKLNAFLSSKVDDKLSSRVFVLKGKAGTGKTTIIKYALKKMLEEDKKKINRNDMSFDLFSFPNVVGVTQSHKAKNVLMQSLWACKTFASCFGLKQAYGPDGQIKFEKPKKKNNGFDKPPMASLPINVFVHDECSMYDISMLNYVLQDTNYASKIIFMGDPGQIPPISCVGDEDSPVFSLDLPEENQHTLIERVRQTAGNPILELSDIIYEEIFGSQNMERVLEALRQENYKDGKGFRHVRRSEFLNDYKKISEDYTDTKVVAYRNATVDNYNNGIRRYIYGNPDKAFIVNEIIYMNDTYCKENGQGKVQFQCYNSDEYKIEKIDEIEIDGLKTIKLYVDGLTRYIPVVHPFSLAEFNKNCSSLAYWAKQAQGYEIGKKWGQYYTYKGQWGDVSYGYCYTGHKIQGSGYKNIYVDVNDILTVSMISNKRKLQSIYTAITRATDLVILIKQ